MTNNFVLKYVTTIENNNDVDKILKFNNEDSGLDIHCYEDNVEVLPKSKKTINLGIKCQLFKNNYNSAFWLIPRSSISKTPLIMANSIGLIDSGYRGELKAVVYNTSDESFFIEKYTRLFQIVNPEMISFKKVERVYNIEESLRGENGFGSTGNC
jgi:dUTP pyrophosphatase